jgi:hypothetical protein
MLYVFFYKDYARREFASEIVTTIKSTQIRYQIELRIATLSS